MLTTILIILVLAFVCEVVDSGVGMGYGTILSPTLLLMGFDPLIVVPALVLSQSIGGFVASRNHQNLKNASVWDWKTRDGKLGLLIGGAGVLAAILSATLAIHVSKAFVQGYIGWMVLVMGIIMLTGWKLNFSWTKVSIVAIISAFNKGISGGGYGPIVTSGQMIAGQEYKSAIGITTFAEVPICLASFGAYLFAKGGDLLSNPILIALCAGAGLAGMVGPHITKHIPMRHARLIIGCLVTFLGAFALLKGGKV